MAIANLEDLDGFVEVLVFPKVFSQNSMMVRMNATIFIKGRINLRDKEPKIVAEEIIPLSEVQQRYTKSMKIDLLTTGLEEEMLTKLKDILSRYLGKVPVYLGFLSPDKQQVQLKLSPDYCIEPSEKLISEIETALGEGVFTLKK